MARPAAALPRDAADALDARCSTAATLSWRSTTTRPSSSDSRMFSLNARSRSSSMAFVVELTVEPRVLERGGHLRRNGGQQRHVLAAQRLARVLAAECEDRGRARLRDARHEVVQAGVAPELDFLGGKPSHRGRIVERHEVAAGQAPADARESWQRRQRRRDSRRRASPPTRAPTRFRPSAPSSRLRAFPPRATRAARSGARDRGRC